jgi:hypothetical protein
MTVIDTSRLDESFEDGIYNIPGTTTDTSTSVNSVPTSRTISFTITSEPNGSSILLNGQNTNYVTPHTMNFQETELLTPKILTVVNGTNQSLETYIISSEIITTTTGTSSNNNSGATTTGTSSNSNSGATTTGTSSSGNSGRGNSNGGGSDSDNSTNPSDTNFRPELAPGARPTGNAQR